MNLVSKAIFIAFLLSLMVGCYLRTTRCDTRPEFLCEMFVELDQEVPSQTLDELKTANQAEIVRFHFTVGRHIRNRYALSENNEVTNYFRTLGVDEPDDVSTYITLAYQRHLNGGSLRIDELVKAARIPPPPDREQLP